MMMSFAFTDPIMLAIVIGAIQNVLSKSSKYTLFDSTKEMSYVPLDEQLKTRGKAAADMIGTKLGKSTSALLQSMIFVIFPAATYSSISVYLMCIFTVVCIIWVWAVLQLNKEYTNACNSRGDESFLNRLRLSLINPPYDPNNNFIGEEGQLSVYKVKI